jgi:hypothetical protein
MKRQWNTVVNKTLGAGVLLCSPAIRWLTVH